MDHLLTAGWSGLFGIRKVEDCLLQHLRGSYEAIVGKPLNVASQTREVCFLQVTWHPSEHLFIFGTSSKPFYISIQLDTTKMESPPSSALMGTYLHMYAR